MTSQAEAFLGEAESPSAPASPEAGGADAGAASAKRAGKGAGKGARVDLLTAALHKSADEQNATEQLIVDLKVKRKAALDEKKEMAKQIRKVKKNAAKKDKVLARRSIHTLVAEVERRVAEQQKKSAAEASTG